MSHLVELPVRFGHVDQARIVYYPHFFHFCHEAMEVTFAEAVGVSYPDVLNRDRLGFPAVHIETDFANPAGFGETLRIAVSVAALGRTSVTFAFDATRASDGESVFRARIVTVCVDMTTFTPVAVPPRYREAFERLGAPGAA